MAEMGKVISRRTLNSWKQQLLKAKQSNKLVVVMFTATCCGPCRAMTPIVEELARKMSNVVFLKVDVDQLFCVANELGVGAIPSFQFFKKGKLVDKFVGAKKDVLRKTVSQHAASSCLELPA